MDKIEEGKSLFLYFPHKCKNICKIIKKNETMLVSQCKVKTRTAIVKKLFKR